LVLVVLVKQMEVILFSVALLPLVVVAAVIIMLVRTVAPAAVGLVVFQLTTPVVRHLQDKAITAETQGTFTEAAAAAQALLVEMGKEFQFIDRAMVVTVQLHSMEMFMQAAAAAVLADLTALVEQVAAVAVHLVEEAQALVVRTLAAAAAAVGMTTAEVRDNQTQVVLGLWLFAILIHMQKQHQQLDHQL